MTLPAGAVPPTRSAERARSLREWRTLAILGLVVFVALTALNAKITGQVPWNYLVGVLLTMEIYALFVLGLSLEFGFTGLINFGHIAFMAVGAYTVAIFGERAGPTLAPRLQGASVLGALVVLLAALVAGALVASVFALATRRTRVALLAGIVAVLVVAFLLFPLGAQGAKNGVVFLGLLLGCAFAAILALFVGLPTVRLREDYLAIATIGFAEIVRAIATNEDQLTHGTLGILSLDRPVVDFALANPTWLSFTRALGIGPVGLAHALLAGLALAFAFVLLEALARSPWGRVVKAVRDDEDAASSLGKNALATKLQALVLGSVLAAVAGVLLSWNLSSVYPDHYLLVTSYFAWMMMVIGGVANHKGALAGALIFVGIFEFAGNLPSVIGASATSISPLASLALVAAAGHAGALFFLRESRERARRAVALSLPLFPVVFWLVARGGTALFFVALAVLAAAAALVADRLAKGTAPRRFARTASMGFAGALAGAALLLLVAGAASTHSIVGPPQQIFAGLVLILVMMFRPQGLLGRKEELLFAK